MALTDREQELWDAVDHIEGALMGFGDLVDLPALFEDARDDLGLNVKVTVGQMRRVCMALAECTRILIE